MKGLTLTLVIIILIQVTIWTTYGTIGYLNLKNTPALEPQIVEVEVAKTSPPEIIRETITETETVEVTIPTKWWLDASSFQRWLEENRLPHNAIPDLKAQAYIDLAESQGYRLMEVPVIQGFICGQQVGLTTIPYHVGLLTKIGSWYYYADPGYSDILRIVKVW